MIVHKPSFIGSREYMDKPFWWLFCILGGCAILALLSASSTLIYKDGVGVLLKQVALLGVGGLMVYYMQLLPSWMMKGLGYALLAVSVLCLYLVVIPGSPFATNLNDASRWFKLPFGLSFQPSEMAKPALIIVVADRLTRAKTKEELRKEFFITLGISAVVCLPILLGNLSTALLLAGVVFLMWILARVDGKLLGMVAGVVAATLLIGYFTVEMAYIRPHREMTGPFKRSVTWCKRVDAAFQHKDDTAEFRLTDENRQQSLAKVAIARGGKTPVGVFFGHSKERDYLPLAYADYIFPIIVEETGIIGAIMLIVLYLAVLFRACWTSSKYENLGAMLMVMGLALMLTLQALVSMMVSCDMGVVTGQPLPLISKGGTSALFTCFYFGVMLAVAREQNELRASAIQAQQESFDSTPDLPDLPEVSVNDEDEHEPVEIELEIN